MQGNALLRACGIGKSFGSVKVLDGVDFDVCPGEVHTLMGENGAGKSTLLKILGGIHQAEEGEILLEDEPVSIPSPIAAQRLRIALIHQEPLVFPDLDVAENIFIGHREGFPLWQRVPWRQHYREAERLLKRLGVQLDPRARTAGLTIADQQMVEMAGALSQNSRILLMDEPTASLTPSEVEHLFEIVRRLKEQGTAIVFISHRLEEVFSVSDRITVLRDGRLIGVRRREESDANEIIQMMVGRPLEELYEKTEAPIGKPVLEVSGLTRRNRFEEISFDARGGEIVGFAGLVGAGRTDVAKALFGIAPAESGTIKLRGKEVSISRPQDAIRLGMALLPEDRQEQGLFLDFPMSTNTTASHLRELFPMKWISPRKEREITDGYREQLRIVSRDARQPARELSGGNQQKVVLAKWLLTGPEILLLDEPTRGVDVGAKREVHRLMGKLSAQGTAIILISSDLPEILAIADRIFVMREGKTTGHFTRKEATPEKIMSAATGQPVIENL